MKNKIFSVPIQSYTLESITDDIAKLNANIYHLESNPNGSYFEESCLENSRDSFSNKPLVCAVTYDEKGNPIDFEGHEDYEKPIGVIPESNNYNIVEIDNLRWVNVDAIIFKEYCGDAYELIKDGKRLSMEIEVLDGEYGKDGFYHIKQFNLLGVTVLGDDLSPAMGEDATITLYNNTVTADKFLANFSNILKKANEISINNSIQGGKEVKRDEILKKFSIVSKTEEYATIVKNDKLTDEELEKQLFALSSNQTRSFLSEAISKEKYTCKYWGESYEEIKYYIRDVIFDDKKVVACDCEENYNTFFINYDFNGDKAVIDFTSKKRCIVGDWREYVEGDVEENVISTFSENIVSKANEEIDNAKNSFDVKNTEDYKDLKKEVETVKSDFTTIQSDKAALEEEVEDLRKFKLDVVKKNVEAEVDSVVERFSELKEVEGFATIFEKRFDYSIEELETKLKVFAFDNGIILGKKQKFTKKIENNGALVIEKTPESTTNSAWDILNL